MAHDILQVERWPSPGDSPQRPFARSTVWLCRVALSATLPLLVTLRCGGLDVALDERVEPDLHVVELVHGDGQRDAVAQPRGPARGVGVGLLAEDVEYDLVFARLDLLGHVDADLYLLDLVPLQLAEQAARHIDIPQDVGAGGEGADPRHPDVVAVGAVALVDGGERHH